MAGVKAVDEQMGSGPEAVQHLTKDMIETIKYIIERQKSAEKATTDASEDIKGLATKMGRKPGEVKEMISLIRREQDKGGVIIAKTGILGLAEQAMSDPALAVAAPQEEEKK